MIPGEQCRIESIPLRTLGGSRGFVIHAPVAYKYELEVGKKYDMVLTLSEVQDETE